MMSVFELPHTFIVFPPGGGGNFIAGLLNKLLTNNRDDIVIATSGSSHSMNSRKENGKDYISFGTFVSERHAFDTEENRIAHYIDKIKDITEPQITWTHDYTNIPIYKSLFPNAKILVITATSDKEKLTITLMHVIKNLLDANVSTPFTPEERSDIISRWHNSVIDDLARVIPKDKLSEALSDDDIVQFMYINKMLRYYGLLEYQHMSVSDKKGHLNPRPYDIENLTNCICLPYRYIVNDSIDLLTSVLEQVLSKSFTNEASEFARYTTKLYRNNQNPQILEDPHQYYNQLASKAKSKIRELKLLN